jgi:hypothetical protein
VPRRLALALLLAALAAPACDRKERPYDAKVLCDLAAAAARSGDPEALYAEIVRELRVARKDLRPHADGVFVPTGHLLFQEWGIFVTKPGVTLPASHDPTFVREDVCVYSYRYGG